MTLNFNTNGNEKQKLCAKYWIDQETIDIVYGGSKGSAKSYTGCSLIFGDAFIYPETHYFIARKTLKDLRNFTRPSIHEVFQHWGLTDNYFKFNGQDNYYELYNKSKVYLLEAKKIPSDPDFQRFGSMQMTRGWIEEAGEFEESAKNNLQASIGRWKNDIYKLPPKLLQTCNPSKNYLYRDYYKPFKEGKLESWRKFIQALPTDNTMLPKDYIPNLLKILSGNEVERLVKGNWEYDDNPNALFDYDNILNLFSNDFVFQEGEEKYLTCDIAYEGSDLFVIGYWEGWTLIQIWAIDKIDEVLVSKKINEIRIEKGVPITNVAYDADGLKTFVRQSSKTGYLADAKEFYNVGQPIKVEGRLENFKNLKAQCYYYLAEKVSKHEMFIAVKEYRKQIIEELEQIRKLPLKDDGKIALEKKQDLKDRLGRSPDFADMIMMRMVFDLVAEDYYIVGL
jgi:phage terminase large subunit